MSFLARINRQRYREFAVSIFESDGSTDANLATGDVVYCRIGHNVGTDFETALEINSAGVSDGDSIITYTVGTNDCIVKIGMVDAQELDLPIYDCELFVKDVSDTDAAGSARVKHCETGVLHVQGSLPEVPEAQSSSSSESSSS